ncbi:hypothetical protein ACJJIG_17210 [Microbulbifer sp. SSSA007]|uniref:hypothetical protein n=1 Tax=Microbulbifer sp. SSSA007 TaxID=3243379 RepID=UPI0040396F59
MTIADPKVWTAIIALTALILSQLPPISVMIKKPKLELEIHQRIFLTHYIGNPTLQIHLIIHNIGGKPIKVKKIDAKIKRDEEEILNLPAQTYVADPKDGKLINLTRFIIKPDEEWNHNTAFINNLSRTAEKEFWENELSLKNEIDKIRAQKEEEFGGKMNEIIEAPDEFVAPFLDLFNNLFVWTPGEYTLDLAIRTNTPKADIVKSFRFTIFETHTESLKKYADDYKSGAGIYWINSQHRGIWLETLEIA